MPEPRGFPKFLPRVGKRLKITFGDPSGVTDEVQSIKQRSATEAPTTILDPKTGVPYDSEAHLRIKITEVLQTAVHRLGAEVALP